MDPRIRPCLVCGRTFEPPTFGRPPVTCSKECHRLRKNVQRGETRQRAVDRGCPDDIHGTVSAYTHYLCRCPKCRLWARTYKQGRRKAAALHNHPG